MANEEPTWTVLLQVLGKHRRVDWSDGTYGCSGCAQDAEAVFQAVVERGGDWKSMREQVHSAKKPNWTNEQYNLHVVEEVRRRVRQIEDETTPLHELDLMVRAHNILYRNHVLTIADLRRLIENIHANRADLPRGIGRRGYDEIVSELARWDARD